MVARRRGHSLYCTVQCTYRVLVQYSTVSSLSMRLPIPSSLGPPHRCLRSAPADFCRCAASAHPASPNTTLLTNSDGVRLTLLLDGAQHNTHGNGDRRHWTLSPALQGGAVQTTASGTWCCLLHCTLMGDSIGRRGASWSRNAIRAMRDNCAETRV